MYVIADPESGFGFGADATPGAKADTKFTAPAMAAAGDKLLAAGSSGAGPAKPIAMRTRSAGSDISVPGFSCISGRLPGVWTHSISSVSIVVTWPSALPTSRRVLTR